MAVNEATGASLAPYVGLAHVAFRGREAEATPLIEAATNELVRRGDGQGLRFIHWATAVLYNGLGRYEEALAAAQQAGEDTNASWWRDWGLVELIEAAARSGSAELAVDALGRLSQTTAASGTDWALGRRGPLAGAADRGRSRRAALSRRRSRRSAGPVSGWSSPAPTSCTANGCAASAAGSTRASSCAAPTSCSRSSAWKRSPSAPAGRARGDRRARPQTDRRDPRRPDPPGSTDLPARSRRCHQPRNRRAAVHQPQHRRLPPPQGIPQARSEVPPPTQTALAPATRTQQPRGSGVLIRAG